MRSSLFLFTRDRGLPMLERDFQPHVIRAIKLTLSDAIVLKNDSSYQQGVPDLIVLYKDKWATLEVKRTLKSRPEPNQTYWVDRMNEMSFSAFINRDNMHDVLDVMFEYVLES